MASIMINFGTNRNTLTRRHLYTPHNNHHLYQVGLPSLLSQFFKSTVIYHVSRGKAFTVRTTSEFSSASDSSRVGSHHKQTMFLNFCMRFRFPSKR
ncbi:hypothetical protein CEXT_157111 [Caerostris extrusa]|uniref:Uncharacterized protein n=1 Tax=Caerostris extrusa TaxID=172846 RepID=A0AAV4XN21_CAEEX|nr:hypothetical protein CEXT_157111 [Caerostris extrusa]